MGYSVEDWDKLNDWNNLLEALGYKEQKNPNGKNCYDVYNEEDIPIWQYETEQEKAWLFMFFTGALYMKRHIEWRK